MHGIFYGKFQVLQVSRYARELLQIDQQIWKRYQAKIILFFV